MVTKCEKYVIMFFVVFEKYTDENCVLQTNILEGFMSKADTIYINMCKDIIENGYSTEGEKVRPKWEDGSYAYTMKRFGIIHD